MPTEDAYLKCITDVAAESQVPSMTSSEADGEGDGVGETETKTDITVSSNSSLLAKLAAETHELSLTNYCAFFAPVCKIVGLGAIEYMNSILPASFYYLACAINAEENLGYKEWFAVAGLTRGRHNGRLATPTVAFGDRDATTCAPRLEAADMTAFKYAINLVVRQAGGFYI